MATVKEIRIGKGLSQVELAQIAGVSFPVISRAENGHAITKDSIEKICKALGVTCEQLEGVTVRARRLG